MAKNPYYHGRQSAHFDGERFHNAHERNNDRSIAQVLRWRIYGRRARWPSAIPVQPAVPEARVHGLRITMVGHATVLIQADGQNILTDPVWSERASPVNFAGPRRATRPGIDFDRLPPIDAVLLSHNHYDHLDMATLKRLHHAHAPLIVTPLGNDTIIRRHIPGARIAAGDWWDRVALRNELEAVIVPANHWSARTMRDRRMALWGGFVLRSSAASTYFAGDTSYGTGRIFREIRERCGAPDVALVPIGGYEPRWFMSEQHCDPVEAVQIMHDLGAQRLIGIHWGTFNLTDEPREEPARMLAEAAARAGIDSHRAVAGTPGQIWNI